MQRYLPIVSHPKTLLSAYFSCGIIPDHGATSPEELKVSTHVKGVRLRARATGELSNKQLNLEAVLREQGQYTVTPTTGGGTDSGEEEPGGGGMLG